MVRERGQGLAACRLTKRSKWIVSQVEKILEQSSITKVQSQF